MTVVLPIDAHLPTICQAIRDYSCVIIEAEPGAGKTTRVPAALLNVVQKRILVLEPRRVAARMSARRVAFEQESRLGDAIGYHVRHDRCFSDDTRVLFVTEGLFLRYLASDPLLSGVDCVILDEFHERHVHSDIALALTRWLQESTRPDLRLVVMSATMDSSALKRWAGPKAEVIQVHGRVFPVRVEYREGLSSWLIEEKVAAAVEDVWGQTTGHVLVFLSGQASIRKTRGLLEGFVSRVEGRLCELFGEQAAREQDAAFADDGRRKVILATNVAETSITIDGVTAVVDSGVAKIPGHATWSGLATLEERPIPQASCVQRAGRAGRTVAGICVRVFSEADFVSRQRFLKPEILRTDLTQWLLDLKALALGGVSLSTFPWLDAPLERDVCAALDILCRLGAVTAEGAVTTLGRRMANQSLPPRLMRVLLAAEELGCIPQALLAVCVVNEGFLLQDGQNPAGIVSHSDVDYQCELFAAKARGERLSGSVARVLNLQRYGRIEAALRELARAWSVSFAECLKVLPTSQLSRCFLVGFSDRVAQVRASQKTTRTGRELSLCLGGGAILDPASVVQDDSFLIAVEARENPAAGNAAFSTRVWAAVAVDTAELLDVPAFPLVESVDVEWDRKAERAVGVARVQYGKLLLDHTPVSGHRNEFEEILSDALRQAWPRPFADGDSLAVYSARRELVLQYQPEAPLPDLGGSDFALFLTSLCAGKSSFLDLRKETLQAHICEQLSFAARKLLDAVAPEICILPSGRKVTVHYVSGQSPWVEAFLQNFFGTPVTPRLGCFHIPLVVHLQAPNRRPLQVTDSLERFWKETYPSLRREYARRYPRHAWPEDPLSAEPPSPRHRY